MGSEVHCRTGSLETLEYAAAVLRSVHCRTGSLEIIGKTGQLQCEFTAVQAA